MNEWDTWKVGDRLKSHKLGVIYTVLSKDKDYHGRDVLRVVDDRGYEYYCYDFGPTNNPTTYFFWLGPPASPVWQTGDQVQREAIRWGTKYGVLLYSTPLRHPYFSHVSTLQTKREVLKCERCGEPNEWAVSNTASGAYRCYQCRQDPWR